MGTFQVAILEFIIQYLVNYLFICSFYSFANGHHILVLESDAKALASASIELLK